MERVGAPFPIGLETRLQRLDVLHFVGLRSAIDKATAILGKVARPSTATDLLSQLNGTVALKIFGLGFIACTIPPFIVWAVGFHIFKVNPAGLMGGVAGARSHSGPAREAATGRSSTKNSRCCRNRTRPLVPAAGDGRVAGRHAAPRLGGSCRRQ